MSDKENIDDLMREAQESPETEAPELHPADQMVATIQASYNNCPVQMIADPLHNSEGQQVTALTFMLQDIITNFVKSGRVDRRGVRIALESVLDQNANAE